MQVKNQKKSELFINNKNGMPFHDRKWITNFLEYHEKITIGSFELKRSIGLSRQISLIRVKALYVRGWVSENALFTLVLSSYWTQYTNTCYVVMETGCDNYLIWKWHTKCIFIPKLRAWDTVDVRSAIILEYLSRIKRIVTSHCYFTRLNLRKMGPF